MTAPTARSERGWLLVAWLGLLSGLVATWVFADDALSAFLLPLPPAMMTVAGTVIVRRTDVPRIGGLLLVSGTWVGWYGALFAGLPATGAGALGAGLAVASAAVYPLFLIIVLFPTGRFPSPFARWASVAYGVGTLASTVALAGAALDLLGGTTWQQVADVSAPLAVAAGVAAVIIHVRAQRHRSREERLQTKWFVFIVPAIVSGTLAGALGLPEEVVSLVGSVAPVALPLLILLAITRYRLYEVDRLVSRTVGYALVVALLAGVAVGTLALLTTVLPTEDRLATAAATLAVLALSGPLRRRVLTAVDRRFDRTRYVAQQVVEDFGRRVADETDLDAVRARLHHVLGTTLAPTTVAVWEPGEDAA